MASNSNSIENIMEDCIENIRENCIEERMRTLQTMLGYISMEVSKSINFLETVEKNCERMVKELDRITSPTAYLKAFSNVNSFLLKSLSAVVESNCGLEMSILESQVIAELRQANVDTTKEDDFEFVNLDGDNNEVDKNSSKQQAILPHEEMFDSVQAQPLETEDTEIEKGSTDQNFQTNEAAENLDALWEAFFNGEETSPELDEDASEDGPLQADEDALEDGPLQVDEDASEDGPLQTDEDASENGALQADEDVSEDGPVQADEDTSEQKDESDTSEPQLAQAPNYAHINEEVTPFNIPGNLRKDLYVSVDRIISPSHFCVHFDHHELHPGRNLDLELYSICNTLRDCEEDEMAEKPSKALLSKELGLYALYYIKCHNLIYRVKVIDWSLSDENAPVHVYLLDEAHYQYVPFESLRPMPRHMIRYPASLRRCHLYGVRPLGVFTQNPSDWEEEATRYMTHIIDNAEGVKVEIVSDDFFDSEISLPVLLWINDKHFKCVNKLLVTKNFAKAEVEFLMSKNDRMEQERLHNWNPMKEDFESHNNNYELDVNDPAAIIYGYVGKDYKRVCLQYSRTGKCYKGDTCKKEHEFLDPSGFTTDKEEVYKSSFNILKPPPIRSIIRVVITSVENVNRFYCVLHSLYGTTNSDDDDDTLNGLVSYMNDEENVRKMKELFVPPSIGQLVVAKYWEDGSWYRAKVLESEPENDRFKVIFVDYGNQETVKLSDIRGIEPMYLHLPLVGMQCFIYGITKNPNVCDEEVIDYLYEKMVDKELKIEVVSHFPGSDISLLVKVFDEDGKDIGQELITKKYALKKNDVLLNPAMDMIPG